MNIIFPALVGTTTIDPFWEEQANAAKKAGFNISIAKDQNDRGDFKIYKSSLYESYLYRGWIVKLPYYKEMNDYVECLQGNLFNNIEKYSWSFNFPDWYKELNGETPESIIYTADQIVELGMTKIAEEVAVRVGNKSLILKDYLKSRKHEWFDACFIKDASDVNDVIRVMTNFFNLQGKDFYGGLVFREFLQLKKLGIHPKSGMPLPVEFRTFFVKQNTMITSMYWNNDIPYPNDVEQPPKDWLESIGKKMKSPFVALDIAQSEDGKWWVIEVNDGGTAGYPDNLINDHFYDLLYQNLNK